MLYTHSHNYHQTPNLLLLINTKKQNDVEETSQKSSHLSPVTTTNKIEYTMTTEHNKQLHKYSHTQIDKISVLLGMGKFLPTQLHQKPTMLPTKETDQEPDSTS
jgi:hypothetical protein